MREGVSRIFFFSSFCIKCICSLSFGKRVVCRALQALPVHFHPASRNAIVTPAMARRANVRASSGTDHLQHVVAFSGDQFFLLGSAHPEQAHPQQGRSAGQSVGAGTIGWLQMPLNRIFCRKRDSRFAGRGP